MKKLGFLAVMVASCVAASPASADEEHPALSGAVEAFHDVLSPDWHRAGGPERNAAACGNAARYASLAETIVEEPSPAGSQVAAWPSAAAGLRDASVALGAYCASGNDANVVAGLTTLHDRFHDLMKAMRPAAAE